MVPPTDPRHVNLSRRTAIQAGAVGILGLGMNHVSALRAADVKTAKPATGRGRSP